MSLYAFIGLDNNKELRVHVSPFKLNKLSAMHERGKPFPSGAEDVVSNEDIPRLLEGLTNYFQEYEEGKRSKKKQAVK